MVTGLLLTGMVVTTLRSAVSTTVTVFALKLAT